MGHCSFPVLTVAQHLALTRALGAAGTPEPPAPLRVGWSASQLLRGLCSELCAEQHCPSLGPPEAGRHGPAWENLQSACVMHVHVDSEELLGNWLKKGLLGT